MVSVPAMNCWAFCGAERVAAAVSHVEAAVDSPNLAGDVRGGVGGKEVNHPRNLLRLAETTDRNLAGDLRDHLLGHRRDHLRANEAGGNGIDGKPNPFRTAFAGPGALERSFLRQGLG